MTCQFLNYPNLKLYKFDDITVQLVVQCRTCLLSCWLPSIFADEADHPHNGLKYFLRNNSNFCTWFQVSNNVSDLANICVPWSWFNVCFVNNSPSERISAQCDAVSYCGSHPRQGLLDQMDCTLSACAKFESSNPGLILGTRITPLG